MALNPSNSSNLEQLALKGLRMLSFYMSIIINCHFIISENLSISWTAVLEIRSFTARLAAVAVVVIVNVAQSWNTGMFVFRSSSNWYWAGCPRCLGWRRRRRRRRTWAERKSSRWHTRRHWWWGMADVVLPFVASLPAQLFVLFTDWGWLQHQLSAEWCAAGSLATLNPSKRSGVRWCHISKCSVSSRSNVHI